MFLRRFLIFNKFQPNVSHQLVSYKNNVCLDAAKNEKKPEI